MCNKIPIGATARDKITGFTGVVVAIHRYAAGTQLLSLQPKMTSEDKACPEDKSFDLERCEQLNIDIIPCVSLDPEADRIQFGMQVRDTITGFVGIVNGRHEFFSGCVQFSVYPAVVKNEIKGSESFDHKKLQILKPATVEFRRTQNPDKPTGGPQPPVQDRLSSIRQHH